MPKQLNPQELADALTEMVRALTDNRFSLITFQSLGKYIYVLHEDSGESWRIKLEAV